MPVAQPLEQLGQKCPQALGTDPVGRRPAHAQQGHLSGPVRQWATTDAPRAVLSWWITQQDQRVLPRVLGDLTEVIQKLALLASTGVGIARRQRSRPIVPTGLLPLLLAGGSRRGCFE